MQSSILKKLGWVKMTLTGDSNYDDVLSGSSAELREDLDQAKTQMGMTESLLKALSPSDSWEILTKLEVLPSGFSPPVQICFTLFFFLNLGLLIKNSHILKRRKNWVKNSEKQFMLV